MNLLRALEPLALLVLPTECAGCGRPDTVVCEGCRELLTAVDEPELDLPVPARVAARYEGDLARLVPAWKDDGRLDAAPALAAGLARALAALPVPGHVVVPVPSSRAAVRRRGEDVVRDLARRAAGAQTRAPDPSAGAASRPASRVVPALVPARRVLDQAGLGVRERARNVSGAFGVPARRAAQVRGRACVVVDDVLTTGATVREAVRALEAVGARVVGVAAVCATPRRETSHSRRTAGRDQSGVWSPSVTPPRGGHPTRRARPLD